VRAGETAGVVAVDYVGVPVLLSRRRNDDYPLYAPL
jgi:hypothetical protein